VTFRWKNYARASELATMTLKAEEFMRRFLLHVLPTGFVKIRHFGFQANRGRRDNLRLCRQLLAASSTTPPGLARTTRRRTNRKLRRPIIVRAVWSEV
jgi:putative transposase